MRNIVALIAIFIAIGAFSVAHADSPCDPLATPDFYKGITDIQTDIALRKELYRYNQGSNSGNANIIVPDIGIMSGDSRSAFLDYLAAQSQFNYSDSTNIALITSKLSQGNAELFVKCIDGNADPLVVTVDAFSNDSATLRFWWDTNIVPAVAGSYVVTRNGYTQAPINLQGIHEMSSSNKTIGFALTPNQGGLHPGEEIAIDVSFWVNGKQASPYTRTVRLQYVPKTTLHVPTFHRAGQYSINVPYTHADGGISLTASLVTAGSGYYFVVPDPTDPNKTFGHDFKHSAFINNERYMIDYINPQSAQVREVFDKGENNNNLDSAELDLKWDETYPFVTVDGCAPTIIPDEVRQVDPVSVCQSTSDKFTLK